eukprot:jgi/Hompol1/421/HPOL_000138-RA
MGDIIGADAFLAEFMATTFRAQFVFKDTNTGVQQKILAPPINEISESLWSGGMKWAISGRKTQTVGASGEALAAVTALQSGQTGTITAVGDEDSGKEKTNGSGKGEVSPTLSNMIGVLDDDGDGDGEDDGALLLEEVDSLLREADLNDHEIEAN